MTHILITICFFIGNAALGAEARARQADVPVTHHDRDFRTAHRV